MDIHSLISDGHPFVFNVIKAFPETAAKIKHGWMPLHVTCSFQPRNTQLIRLLLELYPKAAEHTTAKGSYPLHLICTYGGSNTSSIEHIIDACPEIASKRAKMHGIHILMGFGGDSIIICLFILQNPPHFPFQSIFLTLSL